MFHLFRRAHTSTSLESKPKWLATKIVFLLTVLVAITVITLPGLVVPVRAVCAPPPPIEPDFEMVADPDFLVRAPGSEDTSIITLTSIDGFADTVNLSVSWDPGLTASLDQTMVVNMPDSVTLTISTDPTIDFGFYDVTVVGSSDSPPRENSAVVTVHVPDFSVDASPTFLPLNPGQSMESTITVTSELHFTGDVILSTTIFPEEGLTATPSPDSVNLQPGQSKTVALTVTSSESTPPGEYTVEIAGTFDSTPEPIVQSTFVDVLVGGDFRMSASPSSLTIEEEMFADSTITLTSLYEFSGTVDLAVDQDLPEGFTAGLDRQSVFLGAGGTATATLTVNVGDLAQTPAIEFMPVMGISGEKHDSTGVRVSVPGPTIELSTSPDSLRIDPGSADSSIITVTSIRGFNQPIDLTATSFDPCLEVTLSNDPVTPPAGGIVTSTLNIAVDAVTPLDIYFVIVSGVYLDNFLVSDFTVITVIVGDIDTTPPTWPPESSLTSSEVGQTSVTLSWTDAEDNIGVETYEILQDGLPVASVDVITTSYVVMGLSPGTTYEFQVVAYDAAGNSADGPSVPVATAGPTNNAPSLGPIEDKTVQEGEQLTFTATATDPDGDTLTYSLGPGAPSGASINPSTGVFSWTSSIGQAGVYTVTVTVTDNGTPALSDTDSVNITVEPRPVENSPPVLDALGDRTVDEETLLSFTATATDPDGDTLTFSLGPGAPSGASITPSGMFTWTPTEAQNDVYSITIIVSDGTDQDSETIMVTVREVNVAPVLTVIGDKTVVETNELAFTATATDADIPPNTLTFSLELAATGTFPTGASITPGGVLSWTPTADQGPGIYAVRIAVFDGLQADFEDITITVEEPVPGNRPPELATIEDRTVDEETLLSFTATATDPDGDALSFSLGPSAPSGASITSAGMFTWTPTEVQGPGSYEVTIIVSDGEFQDSELIAVAVSEVNRAPVLTAVTGKTVTEGSPLIFAMTASDPDGPTALTFSLEPGAPAGASINPSTGIFSWTPIADQAGTYTITVRVSDGITFDAEQFTVTVSEIQPVAPAPQPFWIEYWYVLLIVVLVLVGIPVAMKVRGKPGSKS